MLLVPRYSYSTTLDAGKSPGGLSRVLGSYSLMGDRVFFLCLEVHLKYLVEFMSSWVAVLGRRQ